MLKQSCRTELWQSSHLDLQANRFENRRKLNPNGNIAEILHSAFKEMNNNSARYQSSVPWWPWDWSAGFALWHSPYIQGGKRKRTAALKRLFWEAGGLNVCMRYDMVILLFTVLFIPTACTAPFKSITSLWCWASHHDEPLRVLLNNFFKATMCTSNLVVKVYIISPSPLFSFQTQL